MLHEHLFGDVFVKHAPVRALALFYSIALTRHIEGGTLGPAGGGGEATGETREGIFECLVNLLRRVLRGWLVACGTNLARKQCAGELKGH